MTVRAIKLRLGYHNRIPVYTNPDELLNAHVACFGSSGSGKTVKLQGLACEVTARGGTVLAISSHGCLSDDQIYPAYAAPFARYQHVIRACSEGIPLPLFDPIRYPDGETESSVVCAGAVTDILGRALHLGVAQRTALRSAVSDVLESGRYRQEGFRALGSALQSADANNLRNLLSGRQTGSISRKQRVLQQELCDRMRPLFDRNVFFHGEGLIQPGKLNMVSLDHFDLDTQSVLTEILLSTLWRMANANCFRERGLYLLLDEFQNLRSDRSAPLALMLSEGRKMGLNLILATQMLLPNSSVVQQRIAQSGLVLYFRPPAHQMLQTAKLIEPGNGKRWLGTLNGLRTGQFIAFGSLLVGRQRVSYPLLVTTNAEELRSFGRSLWEEPTELR